MYIEEVQIAYNKETIPLPDTIAIKWKSLVLEAGEMDLQLKALYPLKGT